MEIVKELVDELLAEQDELIAKTKKLKSFIGTDVYVKTLPGKHKELLRKKLEAMFAYRDVLDELIEYLEES
jgi:hypothetical protein